MGNDQTKAKKSKNKHSSKPGGSREEIEEIKKELLKEREALLSKNGMDILPMFKLKESKGFKERLIRCLRENDSPRPWMGEMVEDLKNYSMNKNGQNLSEYIWLQASKTVLTSLQCKSNMETLKKAIKHKDSQLFSTSAKNSNKKETYCHVILESESKEDLPSPKSNESPQNKKFPLMGNLPNTSIEGDHYLGKQSESNQEEEAVFKEPLNNTLIVEEGSPKGGELTIAYKIIMDYVEKFLGSQNNVLGFILARFRVRLLVKYDKYLARPAESLDPLVICQMKDDLSADIRSFTSFLTDEVLDYFSLKSMPRSSSFRKIPLSADCSPKKPINSLSRMTTKDSCSEFLTLGPKINRVYIYGFVMSVLFDPETYGVVFGLMRCGEREEENVFRANLWKLADCGPDAFGVDPVFCLDLESIEGGIKELKECSNPEDEIQNTFFSSELSFDDEGDNKKSIVIGGQQTGSITSIKNQKDFGSDRIIAQQEPKKPKAPAYKKTIQMLSFINFTRSPYHKLKLLLDVSESIQKEIVEFYQTQTGKPPLYLPGEEQLIAILIYIISNCKVTSILTHCQMITAFLPETVIFRYSGYFINQVIQCIDTIYKIVPEESEPLMRSFEDSVILQKDLHLFQESVRNSIFLTLEAMKGKEVSRQSGNIYESLKNLSTNDSPKIIKLRQKVNA